MIKRKLILTAAKNVGNPTSHCFKDMVVGRSNLGVIGTSAIHPICEFAL